MGETPNVTRRALLGGIAAAGAASLVAPAAGLADALDRSPAVSSCWIGSLRGESAPIQAPRRFVLAGIQWVSPAAASIELRAQAPSGRWSPWVAASTLGHEGDAGPAGPGGPAPGLFAEPVWTGVADLIQLRSDRPVEGLRAHFVSLAQPPAGAASARAASARPLATPVLDAGPGQPPIIARRGWAMGQARPRHAPTYGAVDLAFVHHTVNPNGYSAAEVPAMLLAIFYYHVQVRGFWDIAYNFIVDLYGRIWEARAGGIDMAVIGAQAGAYNAESTGIAVLGDFMNVVPSPAAITALQHLLAWKLSLHGLPAQGHVTVVVDPADAFYTPFAPGAHVSLPRIAGHRDGDETDCPGNAFYARLPSIRPRVAALAGSPARLTLSPPASVARAGTPVTVSGRLRLLGGEPLVGAPVALQQLRLRGLSASADTIATATTAADGSWSAALTLSTDTLLRALHRPGPSAVSDWAAVAVAPVIALALDTSTPLRVSGTIAPGKRQVTVDLYPAGRTARKPLRSRKVRVSRGRFTVTLPPPPPGDYVIIARRAADSLNAAGTSAPLPVTVS